MIRELFTKRGTIIVFAALVLATGWFISVILAIGIAVAGNVLMTYIISGPAYKGAVTDHFNGKKFTNPTGVKAKGFREVLKWMMNRDRGKWETPGNFQYGEAPVERVTNGLRITFVNHSTFLIQSDGVNILTDPVWSDRVSPFTWAGPKRIRPAGIRFEDLPPIDIILLSHNHYDHLDMPTMQLVFEKFQPKIFTALGVSALLRQYGIKNVVDMDWWQEVTLSGSLQLVAVPAQHFSGRGTFDRDATLWCGFVIARKEGNIYFAGDTGYNDVTFKEIGSRFDPISIAIVPIGAYKPRWFMSPIHTAPREAVQIHLDLRAHKSIACHFGTFTLADEGQEELFRDLETALKGLNVPAPDFLVLKEGVPITF